MRHLLLYAAPVVTNTAIRLVSIMVTSYFIGPEEVGAASLVLAIILLISTIAACTHGYVVNEKCRPHSPAPADVAPTLATFELAISLPLLGVASLVIWFGGAALAPVAAQWTVEVVLVAFLTLLINPLWSIGTHLVGLNSFSGLYFVSISGGALGQLAGSALYFVLLGPRWEALIWGNAAGAVVSASCGLVALRRLSADPPRLSQLIWRRAWTLFPVASTGSLSEGAAPVVERTALSHVSLFSVGLFAHSQTYKQIMVSVGKSIQLYAWPAMMAAGRSGGPTVPIVAQVRRFWSAFHLALGLGGFGLAFSIEALIGLLTHGKFVGAAPLVMLWIITVILQFTGRLEQAALYANGKGSELGRASILSGVAFLIAVIPAVALWGIYGPVAAWTARELAFRLMCRRYARRVTDLPFGDWFAGIAILLVLGGMWAAASWKPDLVTSSLITAAGAGAAALILLAAARRVVDATEGGDEAAASVDAG